MALGVPNKLAGKCMGGYFLMVLKQKKRKKIYIYIYYRSDPSYRANFTVVFVLKPLKGILNHT